MAILDRTRKILWAKAGGRCSICGELLVTEQTDTDDPSVFGQEAHIISEAATGPRAGNLSDHDVYDNLILLCSKDHKRVDDQVGKYTSERLRQIKLDHEKWIAGLDKKSKIIQTESDQPDWVKRIKEQQKVVFYLEHRLDSLGIKMTGMDIQTGLVYITIQRPDMAPLSTEGAEALDQRARDVIAMVADYHRIPIYVNGLGIDGLFEPKSGLTQ